MGSKKVVPTFRSRRSIVMAVAKTGSLSRRRIAVIRILHTNRGMWNSVIELLVRVNKIVTRKLIAPMIDLAPARCRLKIARSTPTPEWY